MSFLSRAFIFLFFFPLSSQLYCQKRFTDKWQYQLAKSENLTRPVRFWIFSNGAEKTGFSILAVQNEQIKWIDDVGSKVFDLPEGYLNTVFSKSGNYFGILSLIESAKMNNQDRILQLEIYSSSGEKLYSLNRNQYYDDSIPSVVISDLDGSVIIGQNTVGKLWFYRKGGELSRELELFPDASYDLERILYMDLSEDGRSLAVVASKRGASQQGSSAPDPSGEPHLFLLTHRGDEVWTQALPGFNTSATAISENGGYIIANSYTVDMHGNIRKMTALFNNDGETIASFDLLFKYAHFSPDSEFLILAENRKARVVELSTGRTVWSHNLSRDLGMITEVRLANKAAVAVLLVAKNQFREGSFVFTNARLEVFDGFGALHQEMVIEDKIFTKPALRLSPDHQHITVGFEDSCLIYEADK